MSPDFATGSDHRLSGDNKSALALERMDKKAFFPRVIILIEAACLLKGAAGAEQASSTWETVEQATDRFSKQQ
jgi:hypothetical protein